MNSLERWQYVQQRRTDQPRMSFAAIGKVLGVTRERVRQISKAPAPSIFADGKPGPPIVFRTCTRCGQDRKLVEIRPLSHKHAGICYQCIPKRVWTARPIQPPKEGNGFRQPPKSGDRFWKELTMTDLRERQTGDSTYLDRVGRYEYIVARRAEKPRPTMEQIARELGISKQNVSRMLARGTVRPSGRQRNSDGQKRHLVSRLTLWQTRRAFKLSKGLDVAFEEKWIADLEGRLKALA